MEEELGIVNVFHLRKATLKIDFIDKQHIHMWRTLNLHKDFNLNLSVAVLVVII